MPRPVSMASTPAERSSNGLDTSRRRVARWAQKHGASMVRWASRLVGFDRDAAEDAVQESFVIALRRAQIVREDAERAWLLGVVRRVCSRHRSRCSVLRELPLGGDEICERADAGGGIERTAIVRERSIVIQRCLDRLPDRQRHLLFLVFGEDLTVDQASQVLGVSVGAGRTHYHRAKESLRVWLRREGIDDV